MNFQTATRPHPATLLTVVLFGLALAAFMYLHATKPIWDPDFWWHLKAGEVMVKERSLLHSDPFSFTSKDTITLRESLILKSYWLWQVTAYVLYELLGFKGIFFLNLLTIGAMGSTLAFQMHRHRIDWGLAAPLMTAGFFLLQVYNMERPQVVSFLFASILMGLILEVRQGGRFGWSLPLVMCLWANLHGGFVVGDIMLGCFSLGATYEYRKNPSHLKSLLFWPLAGIAASLLNPAGGLAFVEMLSLVGSPLQYGITEYNSTWAEFADGNRLVTILWGLICLYLIGAVLSRRLYWPEVLAGLFLSYFAARYMRNIAFFSIAMLPAIGLSWKEAAHRLKWHIPRAVGVAGIWLSIILLCWLASSQWKARQFTGEVAAIYPEAAIDFLQKSQLDGRMFNNYEYGGYLLWRLAPKIKVFIDGRGLNEDVYEDYKKIKFTSHVKINGKSEYLFLLEKYDISFVVQEIYDGYGNVQPLMKELLKIDEWLPIYLDQHVYILARKTNENRNTVESFRIDKNEFKNRLLAIYSRLKIANPQQIGFRVAFAGMLIYLGDYQQAQAEIDAIAMQSPREKMLPLLRQELHLLAGRLNRQ